jgi:hypothetical protein
METFITALPWLALAVIVIIYLLNRRKIIRLEKEKESLENEAGKGESRPAQDVRAINALITYKAIQAASISLGTITINAEELLNPDDVKLIKMLAPKGYFPEEFIDRYDLNVEAMTITIDMVKGNHSEQEYWGFNSWEYFLLTRESFITEISEWAYKKTSKEEEAELIRKARKRTYNTARKEEVENAS